VIVSIAVISIFSLFVRVWRAAAARSAWSMTAWPFNGCSFGHSYGSICLVAGRSAWATEVGGMMTVGRARDWYLPLKLLDGFQVVFMGFFHSVESELQTLQFATEVIDLFFVMVWRRGVSSDFNLDLLVLTLVELGFSFPMMDLILKFVHLFVWVHVLDF